MILTGEEGIDYLFGFRKMGVGFQANLWYEAVKSKFTGENRQGNGSTYAL